MPKGREALEALAHRYPQLYVAPAEGSQEVHRLAAGRGIAPARASLQHFACTDEDELREVETPAGLIEVLFLKNRMDFETFLQIMGHRSQPVSIERSVGAVTYLGLADWGKVAAAYGTYVAAGGDDWRAEFARLAKRPDALRSQLIVISEGPYSNVPAGETPYGEEEWVRVSREIRLYHECTHVVCRRLMPNNVRPIWDEICADVCGLLCATHEYDHRLAARFLGVSAAGYVGGRLTEYLSDDQRERVDEVSREVYATIVHIEELTRGGVEDPFAFVLELGEVHEDDWGVQ